MLFLTVLLPQLITNHKYKKIYIHANTMIYNEDSSHAMIINKLIEIISNNQAYYNRKLKPTYINSFLQNIQKFSLMIMDSNFVYISIWMFPIIFSPIKHAMVQSTLNRMSWESLCLKAGSVSFSRWVIR